MKNKYTLYFIGFLFVLISLTQYASAQKKTIDPKAYGIWETLKATRISEKGTYVSYEVQPLKGDTYLFLYNTVTEKLDSFYRAKSASFSEDEKWMIYKIETGYDTLRNLELAKVVKKKWPKDSIGVYNLETGVNQKIGDIKSFNFDESLNVLVYQLNTNDSLKTKEPVVLKIEAKNSKAKKEKIAKPKKEKAKSKKGEVIIASEEKVEKKFESEGKRMHVYHLNDSSVQVYNNVAEMFTFEKAPYFVYVKEGNKENTIAIYDFEKASSTDLTDIYSSVKSVVRNSFSNEFAFLASKDTAEVKVYELFQFDHSTNTLSCLLDSTNSVFPKGKTVVDNKDIYYSEANNNLLFFYVNDIPQKEPKDSLIESEKVKLDIWTYDEPRLKTAQLVSLKRDLLNADLYVLNLTTKEIYNLDSDTLRIQSDHDEVNEWVVGYNSLPYTLSGMWDYNSWLDVYRINLKTGTKELIRKKISHIESLSRKGDKLVYFDQDKRQYFSIDLNTKVETCLTCSAKNRDWTDLTNGMPMDPTPIQSFGFNKEGTKFFMADRTDAFEYDFTTNSLINLSNDLGRKEQKEFRFFSLSSDSSFVDLSRTGFKVFDKKTKGNEIYLFVDSTFQKVYTVPAQIVYFNSSKDGKIQLMRKNTVSEYANLWIAKDNTNFTKISNANKQQEEYKWATVELIKWKSYKGLELEGLVYKPEDFDPGKSYPMIVYYYETYSESFHAYHGARPTASIVFPTEYASNDYIIFIPDIYYQSGSPAKGAYDCIMSGTDAILKKYPNIDKNRMGLQGQSWGGYQTAMLVTMTDRFKAAMAGAPVSNMFSAYGGIRWGSGMSRMGQYEKGQSRIGKTIWEAPQLYVENSPLFHIPKIKTPLLIMANDQDGAVPWYQGIEMFMGMRRLQKPVWLLNYNGDDHNLMKTANRYDLSIRMMQFFNYYLQNKPEPKWMKEGIPSVLKNKELRYELVED